jgi:hypothetical protein
MRELQNTFTSIAPINSCKIEAIDPFGSLVGPSDVQYLLTVREQDRDAETVSFDFVPPTPCTGHTSLF